MPRDRVSDEIHDLLRQPMGALAHSVAAEWLQCYRSEALQAVHAHSTPERREAALNGSRTELLRKLREVLPAVIRLECHADREISAAQSDAEQTYRQRFDEEVARTLDECDEDRVLAERIARAELLGFRQQLEADLDEVVARHRTQLHQAVRRVLTPG